MKFTSSRFGKRFFATYCIVSVLVAGLALSDPPEETPAAKFFRELFGAPKQVPDDEAICFGILKALAQPLDSALPTPTLESEWVKISGVINVLKTLPPDLLKSEALTQISIDAANCAGILKQIADIEESKLSNVDLVKDGIMALISVRKARDQERTDDQRAEAAVEALGGAVSIFDRIVAEIDLSNLRSSYRDAVFSLQCDIPPVLKEVMSHAKNKQMVQLEIPSRDQSEKVDEDTGYPSGYHPLSPQFISSFNGSLPSDHLRLNSSVPVALHECYILVRCEDDKTYTPHLHYVPLIEKGKPVDFYYPFPQNGSYGPSQAKDSVNEIFVFVYSKEGIITDHLRYDENSRKESLDYLFEKASFSMQILPFESGLLFDDHQGISLSMTGSQFNFNVEKTIVRMGGSKDLDLDTAAEWNKITWENGKAHEFRDRSFDAVGSVDHVHVEFVFPYTSYHPSLNFK